MRTRTLLSTLSLALVMVGCGAFFFAAKPAAQGNSQDNPGNPTILSMIATLQTAIGDLGSALASLQTTVDNMQGTLGQIASPDQSKIRVTPPFPVGSSAGLHCAVTNAGGVSHAIKIEALTFNAAVVDSLTVTVSPGSLTLLQKANIPGSWYYCKFTVTDGSRTDIRGTGMVLGFVGGNPSVLYQVDAE